ncbi:L-threonine synthase [Halovenus aranensis]|uniref:L-threonine synthase n=1 Tax=Halovenus aranensis TaxID=890420 RepID=A0A1G8XS07_9EURY|nr:pyridoxal-phosphate dependent enzyme [Halovenus aranensis]SDJ93462.1 L-threonine synthase [Halovenus aranensis]
METTEGLAGLDCLSCATTTDATTDRCPDCGGILDPVYDDATLERVHQTVREDGEQAHVLPFDDPVTLGEGGVTLVDAPELATEIGAGRVLVADEGHNPTGGLVDRELSVAVTAAREAGVETVALPTSGNGGQAAAAYAARAGLDAECFVPSRSVFANKAMINVHGGEMSVVGGRYPDATEVFAEASADEDWYSLAPFETPYRHEGAKTLAYDLLADLDDAPDAVVHPTSHGTGLYGLTKGFREFVDTGHLDAAPRLYAAQPEGCAPLVDADEDEAAKPTPVEHPDTICGALEVPDPSGGHLVLDALAETGGAAVAVEDDAILEGAASLAAAGIPLSATGGAAAAGAQTLADDGAFDGDETVVLVNPATANREADILRSHLMKQGI